MLKLIEKTLCLDDKKILKSGKLSGTISLVLGIVFILTAIIIMLSFYAKYTEVIDQKQKRIEYIKQISVSEHTKCLKKVSQSMQADLKIIKSLVGAFFIFMILIGMMFMQNGFYIFKLYRIKKEDM